MPDGMEYPSKEADSKLREIVGLTKSQFMQVAMIAQGEFMDLLRAKSDDKKVIFRKLFNTEMYQNIVTELGNRKREKDKEIAILKTQCQTEAVRIRISETYEFQKEMQQSKRQIEEGQMAGLADFMDRLEALCDWMKKELENAERAYQESECARTGKGEELAKAEELLNEQTYDSTMGGGVVKVTVKGSMEIETICIDEALLEKDGKEDLEEMLKSAINDALSKAVKDKEQKMNALTGGVKMPGGF